MGSKKEKKDKEKKKDKKERKDRKHKKEKRSKHSSKEKRSSKHRHSSSSDSSSSDSSGSDVEGMCATVPMYTKNRVWPGCGSQKYRVRRLVALMGPGLGPWGQNRAGTQHALVQKVCF